MSNNPLNPLAASFEPSISNTRAPVTIQTSLSYMTSTEISELINAYRRRYSPEFMSQWPITLLLAYQAHLRLIDGLHEYLVLAEQAEVQANPRASELFDIQAFDRSAQEYIPGSVSSTIGLPALPSRRISTLVRTLLVSTTRTLDIEIRKSEPPFYYSGKLILHKYGPFVCTEILQLYISLLYLHDDLQITSIVAAWNDTCTIPYTEMLTRDASVLFAYIARAHPIDLSTNIRPQVIAREGDPIGTLEEYTQELHFGDSRRKILTKARIASAIVSALRLSMGQNPQRFDGSSIPRPAPIPLPPQTPCSSLIHTKSVSNTSLETCATSRSGFKAVEDPEAEILVENSTGAMEQSDIIPILDAAQSECENQIMLEVISPILADVARPDMTHRAAFEIAKYISEHERIWAFEKYDEQFELEGRRRWWENVEAPIEGSWIR